MVYEEVLPFIEALPPPKLPPIIVIAALIANIDPAQDQAILYGSPVVGEVGKV